MVLAKNLANPISKGVYHYEYQCHNDSCCAAAPPPGQPPQGLGRHYRVDRQFNEWNGSGSRDEQQYAFERLRHCAEQALRSEVVIVQENDDYDSRARLWERQLEDSIKASVHKAKVETKRKARVNALATNVLSDAARQQAALKVQQDFFGGGYR